MQTDRLDQAQEQYGKLQTLCPSGCQQVTQLEKAIVESTLEDLDSESIKNVQRALKASGFYRSSIDGDFGNGSRKALRSFQVAQGITSVGLTAETIAALNL